MTRASGTNFALGIEAAKGALLHDDDTAELLYREAIERLGRSRMRVQAFADRARRELAATGETVRKGTVETPSELTAQEAHIARLVAEGLTNPEIAAALFISPRTVEWHFRKIFTKLGVTRRRQLRQLPHADPAV